MLDFNHLTDLEIENERNPREFRNISEGDYTDLDMINPDYTRGSTRHLESSIWNPEHNIFISDHHSKALAPWLVADRRWRDESVLLLHVDAHRDDSLPRASEKRLSNASDLGRPVDFADLGYISEVIGIAEKYDLADEIYHWGDVRPGTEEPVNSLDKLDPSISDYDRLVLDVDLDVFESLEDYPPEGDWELTDYYKSISDIEAEADLTTYVTSPGFIDQETALDHLESIRQN